MKYLFMIVRHFFPRRRWVIIATGSIYDPDNGPTGRPVGFYRILRDQFGNLKKFRY